MSATTVGWFGNAVDDGALSAHDAQIGLSRAMAHVRGWPDIRINAANAQPGQAPTLVLALSIRVRVEKHWSLLHRVHRESSTEKNGRRLGLSQRSLISKPHFGQCAQ